MHKVSNYMPSHYLSAIPLCAAYNVDGQQQGSRSFINGVGHRNVLKQVILVSLYNSSCATKSWLLTEGLLLVVVKMAVVVGIKRLHAITESCIVVIVSYWPEFTVAFDALRPATMW